MTTHVCPVCGTRWKILPSPETKDTPVPCPPCVAKAAGKDPLAKITTNKEPLGKTTIDKEKK